MNTAQFVYAECPDISGVTRLVGSAIFVEETRPNLLICDLIFRMVFLDSSPILPRFLTEVLGTSNVRKQLEECRTGDASMMQKITKTALAGLSIPLPDTAIQQVLVDELNTVRNYVKVKRAEAVALRKAAWATFESALFTSAELGTE
jgi:restriction endonuclease S subunit